MIGRCQQSWVDLRLQSEIGREIKCGTLSRLALEPDTSVHHGDQASRYGQPQSCAAIAARGGAVGLRKGFEDFVLFLGWNANSRIPNRETYAAGVRRFGL